MLGALNFHNVQKITLKRESASSSNTWTLVRLQIADSHLDVVAFDDAPGHLATITCPGNDTELRTALAALLAECEAMHREYCPKCKAPCPTTAAMDNAKDILARE